MRALAIALLMMLASAAASYAANGYNVPVGATVTIDEHGQCRRVTNPAGQPASRFVSTRTAPEWQSFRDNPNGLVMAACAGCPRPWGGTVAHGASITAYQAASVPHGSSCASQTRTCTNGSLSGTYTHQTCNVQPPASAACALPWGGTIAHGASVNAYRYHTLQEDWPWPNCNYHIQTRTCNNGNLSGGSDYIYATCWVEPCYRVSHCGCNCGAE